MSKKTVFVCQTCQSKSTKWSGQCLNCEEWNTVVEALPPSTKGAYLGYAGADSQLITMSHVKLDEGIRLSSGIKELDRVLGGGLMMGSATLMGGDPGIGKSTLLLQCITHLSHSMTVLYVTGEESLAQITLRARRLSLPENKVWLLAETQVERIVQLVRENDPKVIVIDSIQTLLTERLNSTPGSIGQVRESALQLVNYAKTHAAALFLIGHVTKEGHIAGPRVLEHMVDTVLYFEGEKDSRYRMIRAVKNRFGAVNEIGLFAMTEKGLREVKEPSALFLSHAKVPITGSIVTAIKEGTRPLLIEVQSLVDQSFSPIPRRVAVGLDTQRIAMLLAILHKQTGISMHQLDIFLNVVGGLQVSDTGTDLAILFAVLSSFKDRSLPANLMVFGELGLGGELRPVSDGQERLREAAKHGFKVALVPQANVVKPTPSGLELIGIDSLKKALDYFDSFSKSTEKHLSL